jgi:hypothetical protein
MKTIGLYALGMAAMLAFTACENRQTSTQEETVATKPMASDREPAQQVSNGFASLEFEARDHDFGTVDEGKVVTHTFKFKNVGEAPLVISNIQTSCGCTTPSYTREPVAPGSTGEIQVQFDSRGKAGVNNKRITVYANTATGNEVLSIKCVVNSAAEVAGPYKTQPTR